MEPNEKSLLLGIKTGRTELVGLSLTFAIICIIDVFGVFPIIALPKSIVNCGLSGILLIIFVCATQIYTAILLGRCWLIAEEIHPNIQYKSRYPYSALAEITYGHRLSKAVTFLLDLTVFGGGIPNLIVASQNLELLGLRLTENEFQLSFCYWIILIGVILCPFLWFGSPKDMKCLSAVSVSLVILTFMLIITAITVDTNPLTSVPDVSPTSHTTSILKNLLATYGVLAFQFDIHPTILTIQVDMKNKSKVSKAIAGGFSVSLVLFAITCISASLKYGANIRPSILETLPTSRALHFAALSAALQLGLTSAISNSALYLHIEDCMGVPRDFNPKRCIIRTVLVFLSIVVAESVPRFDIMMSLFGGCLTGPLVFILPPLFYIKMLAFKTRHERDVQFDLQFDNIIMEVGEMPNYLTSLDDENADLPMGRRTGSGTFVLRDSLPFCELVNLGDKVEVIVCFVIIFAGFSASVASTYVNVSNVVEYVVFSSPCIFNLTDVVIDAL